MSEMEYFDKIFVCYLIYPMILCVKIFDWKSEENVVLCDILPILLVILLMMLFNGLLDTQSNLERRKLDKAERRIEKDRAYANLLKECVKATDSLFYALLKTYDRYFAALEHKSTEASAIFSDTEVEERSLRTQLAMAIAKLTPSENEVLCKLVIEQYRQRLNFLSVNYKKIREENIKNGNTGEDVSECETVKRALEDKIESSRKENDLLRNENYILKIRLASRP